MISNLLKNIGLFENFCLKSFADDEFAPKFTFQEYFENYLNIDKDVFESNFDNWINNNSVLKTMQDPRIIKNVIVNVNYNKTQFVSTSNDPNKVFIENAFGLPNIKETKLISGFGKIPNLFYFEVEPINVAKEKNVVDKETAKYDWLFYTFLHGVRPYIDIRSLTQYQIDAVKKFIIENKNNIDKVLNIADHSPKFLGDGDDAAAFDIGNYVLKTYTNKVLYNKNLEQLKALHDNVEISNTEAMIYDVGVLGSTSSRTYYYSIMEKMKPLDGDREYINFIHYLNLEIVSIIRSNNHFWGQFKDKIKDKSNHAEISSAIKSYSKQSADTIKNNIDPSVNLKEYQKELNLKDDFLELYIEEIIMKILSRRKDLHIGNMGVTKNGYLRFFDPYHAISDSDDIDKVNMEAWYEASFK